MNHPVITERGRALARVRPLAAKTRKQAEEEVRRQREAAAAEEAPAVAAEALRRADAEAAVLQLREDIEAKERAEEAERQAILEREAADARETRRLKLVTSAIVATSSIGLIAIYFCAVVLR